MTLERDGLPQLDQYVRALSADGSLLLYGDRPMMVYDVATGASIETLSGDEGEHFFAEFGPEGSVAYISGRDGTLRVWDAAVGSLLSELPAVGGGRPSATVDGRVLIGDTTERVARLLDPSRRGESTSVETCRGFAHANSFNVVGDAAAFIIECSDGRNQVVVADMRESEVVATIRDAYGQDMALSPDGTRVVAQTLSGSI